MAQGSAAQLRAAGCMHTRLLDVVALVQVGAQDAAHDVVLLQPRHERLRTAMQAVRARARALVANAWCVWLGGRV